MTPSSATATASFQNDNTGKYKATRLTPSTSANFSSSSSLTSLRSGTDTSTVTCTIRSSSDDIGRCHILDHISALERDDDVSYDQSSSCSTSASTSVEALVEPRVRQRIETLATSPSAGRSERCCGGERRRATHSGPASKESASASKPCDDGGRILVSAGDYLIRPGGFVVRLCTRCWRAEHCAHFRRRGSVVDPQSGGAIRLDLDALPCTSEDLRKANNRFDTKFDERLMVDVTDPICGRYRRDESGRFRKISSSVDGLLPLSTVTAANRNNCIDDTVLQQRRRKNRRRRVAAESAGGSTSSTSGGSDVENGFVGAREAAANYAAYRPDATVWRRMALHAQRRILWCSLAASATEFHCCACERFACCIDPTHFARAAKITSGYAGSACEEPISAQRFFDGDPIAAKFHCQRLRLPKGFDVVGNPHSTTDNYELNDVVAATTTTTTTTTTTNTNGSSTLPRLCTSPLCAHCQFYWRSADFHRYADEKMVLDGAVDAQDVAFRRLTSSNSASLSDAQVKMTNNKRSTSATGNNNTNNNNNYYLNFIKECLIGVISPPTNSSTHSIGGNNNNNNNNTENMPTEGLLAASATKNRHGRRRKAAGSSGDVLSTDQRIQQLLNRFRYDAAAEDFATASTLSATSVERCAVCAQRRASVRALPCGHQVICRLCVLALIKKIVDTKRESGGLQCVACYRKISALRHQKLPKGSANNGNSEYQLNSKSIIRSNNNTNKLPLSPHTVTATTPSFSSGSGGGSGPINYIVSKFWNWNNNN